MTYAASPDPDPGMGDDGDQAGLVQTCFTAGFGVSLFLTSWLADHIGARRMFVWSCWSGALAALAFALGARSYEEALWLYGLVGLTQGGSYTPAIMLVAQQLPPARRAAAWAGCSRACRPAMSARSARDRIDRAVRLPGRVRRLRARHPRRRRLRQHRQQRSRTASPASGLGRAAPLAAHGAPLAAPDDRLVGHCWELFGMWTWVPAFLIASLGDRIAEASIGLGAVGLGIAIAIALHLSGFLASVTMGRASDRYGRRMVLIAMAAVGALCSFGFGWSGSCRRRCCWRSPRCTGSRPLATPRCCRPR